MIENAARSILRHFQETAEEKPLRLRLMGVRMSEFRDEEASSSKQQTIQGMIKARKRPRFTCPSCNKDVEARIYIGKSLSIIHRLSHVMSVILTPNI